MTVRIPLLVSALSLVRKSGRRAPGNVTAQAQPELLAISSAMDEAWQVLHHISRFDNPLAVKSNLFSYLWTCVRSASSQAWFASRINGAKSYKDLGIVKLIATLVVQLLGLSWTYFTVILVSEGAMKDEEWRFIIGMLWVLFFLALLLFRRIVEEGALSAALSPLVGASANWRRGPVLSLR
jgi:hypothetical protein